jgi:type II secretory pathway pseudopilin PulG
MTRLRRGEAGMSMIEVMLGATLAISVLLFLSVLFVKSLRNSVGHERQAAGVAIAQREIEAARQVVARSSFDALALSSAPSDPPAGPPPETVPRHPNAFLVNSSGTLRFLVYNTYKNTGRGLVAGTPATGERLIVGGTASYPTAGQVAPKSAVSAGGVTATVYRFVTEAKEACVNPPACDGDSRRVVVAVVVDPPNGLSTNDELQLRTPVIASTVIDNPVPKNQAGGQGQGLTVGVNLP